MREITNIWKAEEIYEKFTFSVEDNANAEKEENKANKNDDEEKREATIKAALAPGDKGVEEPGSEEEDVTPTEKEFVEECEPKLCRRHKTYCPQTFHFLSVTEMYQKRKKLAPRPVLL